MTKNNKQELSIREQLNTIIALLVVLVGKDGIKELFKKRHADSDVVGYFQGRLGLSNKDLAGIFNAPENSISNLKKGKKRKIKKEIKKTKKK